MSEIKNLVLERHLDFWSDIYDIEKKEIKLLNDYIVYVDKNLRDYFSFNTNYKNVAIFFMNKHLDYLKEAYTSLLLKNYNAFACVMRIMIENYVSLYMIKKYKDKNIVQNWYLWSIQKMLKKVESDDIYRKIKENYDLICVNLNANDIRFNMQAYGLLQNVVKLKNYSFKTISSLIDIEIYHDYSDLSGYIHNTDMYYKTNWIDMTLLSHFIFLTFSFTDKMIRIYNPYIIRKKDYRSLVKNLMSSLNSCIKYREDKII